MSNVGSVQAGYHLTAVRRASDTLSKKERSNAATLSIRWLVLPQ